MKSDNNNYNSKNCNAFDFDGRFGGASIVVKGYDDEQRKM